MSSANFSEKKKKKIINDMSSTVFAYSMQNLSSACCYRLLADSWLMMYFSYFFLKIELVISFIQYTGSDISAIHLKCHLK